MQHLNNVVLVGEMITITVVYIYVQVLHHGIHLEIIQQDFVQYFVHRDFMQTVIQEQDNVWVHVQEVMIFMVM